MVAMAPHPIILYLLDRFNLSEVLKTLFSTVPVSILIGGVAAQKAQNDLE